MIKVTVHFARLGKSKPYAKGEAQGNFTNQNSDGVPTLETS
jgi:hypothetical protein